MPTIRGYLFVALLLAVSGCQQPMAWNKPGASTADFDAHRYRCMQESQQQTSSAYVNRYGGYASSGQSTNEALFQACMNAGGWSLQRDVPADVKAELKDRVDQLDRICADPRYAPYYRKSACRADEITLQQLTDTSKISPEVRAIFLELRGKLEVLNQGSAALLRRSGGPTGAKAAAAFEATIPDHNQNNLALYEGQITWGEYNRRSQRIHQDVTAAVSGAG
jgi:hypothetical protein